MIFWIFSCTSASLRVATTLSPQPFRVIGLLWQELHPHSSLFSLRTREESTSGAAGISIIRGCPAALAAVLRAAAKRIQVATLSTSFAFGIFIS
jgi:hypothetical protein